MKRIFILLAFLLFISRPSQATNVQGLITTNTTWAKANSPYIVTGQIAVDSAIVLTIEPGVTIKFNGNYNLLCYGKIIAEGTATDSIRFTTNSPNAQPQSWGSIALGTKYTKEPSSFKYCIIEYGTNLGTSGPVLNVDRCVIRYNYDGIIINQVNGCTITNNLITHNYGNAVTSYSMHETIISDNELSYNAAGVYCYNNTDKIYIGYNIMHDNGYGVYTDIYDGEIDVYGNTIYSNVIAGLRLAGDPHASNFNVYNNQLTNNWTGASLLAIHGKMMHNGIYNNNNNVEYTDDNTLDFEYNCMYDAWHQNLVFFHPSNVNLVNNYWGSTDSLKIDSTITDYYDNFTAGKVTFWPFLTSADSGCHTISIPPPPTLAIKNQALQTSGIKVYPNPATTQLTIELDNNESATSIIITDLIGKTVYSTATNTNKQVIDVSQLQAGIYIVKCSNNNTIKTAKIVKN